MPNPLSRVASQGAVRLGTVNHPPFPFAPHLGLKAMEVISTWSLVENQELGCVMQLAGGASEAAASMYLALESTHAKKRALDALAKHALDESDQKILVAIQKLASSLASQRNRIAHWTWGHADNLPDCLLLSDPRVREKLDYSVDNVRDHIFVYKLEDFESIIRGNALAARLFLKFNHYIPHRGRVAGDTLRKELLAEPEIVKRLKPKQAPPDQQALRDVRELLERARRSQDPRLIEQAIERINRELNGT